MGVLELELEVLVLRSFRSLIFCFLRRSFFLPHLPSLSFGIASCNLADVSLSHQGHAFTLQMAACALQCTKPMH